MVGDGGVVTVAEGEVCQWQEGLVLWVCSARRVGPFACGWRLAWHRRAWDVATVVAPRQVGGVFAVREAVLNDG